MTASFAVENAAGYSSDGSTFATGTNPISEKALLLRNLVLAGEFLHSHIIHFFTLAALDYVMGPPISPWTPYFGDAPGDGLTTGLTDWENAISQLTYPDDYQNFFSYYQAYLKPGAIGGTTGFDPLGLNPSGTGWTSPIDELNAQSTIWAKVIANYVEALHWKRKCFELASLFSGAQPMWRNLVMGGLALDAKDSEILNKIDKYEEVLYKGSGGTGTIDNPAPDSLAYFIYNRYYPLVQILAVLYPEYSNTNDQYSDGTTPQYGSGFGEGLKNFLGFGVFNSPDAGPADAEASFASVTGTGNATGPSEISIDFTGGKRLHNRGYYLDGATPTDYELDPNQIVEYIDNSWYQYSSGTYKHPFDGETDPDPTKTGVYSWAKSPRIWHNYPTTPETVEAMEVGPLARMWVSGFYRDGTTYDNQWTHADLGVSAAGLNNIVYGYNKTSFTCGASAIDRHRARAFEELFLVKMTASLLSALRTSITNNPNQPSYTARPLPSGTQGYGLNEAPRGALSHWVVADSDSRIQNHQAVVPSTWNDSPYAAAENGAIEKAILSQPLTLSNTLSRLTKSPGNSVDKLVPLEVLRVVRSFDPCLACTVHVVEKDEKEGRR